MQEDNKQGEGANHNAQSEIFELIRQEISSNDVVLFMKGNEDFPQCGFSAMVVGILHSIGIKFKAIDVLSSDDLRQAIKDFSDWPTIPQLYIKGEFIGGCDIVRDLYEAGELSDLVRNHSPTQNEGIVVGDLSPDLSTNTKNI